MPCCQRSDKPSVIKANNGSSITRQLWIRSQASRTERFFNLWASIGLSSRETQSMDLPQALSGCIPQVPSTPALLLLLQVGKTICQTPHKAAMGDGIEKSYTTGRAH
ncbi:hypothetical protein DPEC_G00102670 [Dallia pectoralis]|uniref:Uncharacterized protein n=1 Tax=Dallia pectoralis TaxID=75939 RepID=A0ACC2GXK6_DALPE|nr:hypothetical protein DPEC_G00102670 [Dallia pectoralis]